jgi:predicted GIY-YIG superfamily endonuclease
MPFYVYELLNPADGRRFYIGMTSCPKKRFRQHLNGCSISTAGFIERLRAYNVKPEMRILAERSSSREALDLEKSLVHRARRLQIAICNTRRGWVAPSGKQNHGAGWTDHDRRRALDMHRRGMHLRVIARELRRSRGSIRGVLRRLTPIATF